MDRLATYGTLMRPFDAQDDLGIAADLIFVDSCQIPGVLFDLGSFPGAVPAGDLPSPPDPESPGDPLVRGELFRIADPSVLPVIDAYEGYDPHRPASSLFLRRRIRLREPEGQAAWVYMYNGPVDDATRIPSGDWRTHE